jgi:hypothetical protein
MGKLRVTMHTNATNSLENVSSRRKLHEKNARLNKKIRRIRC